MTEITKIVLTGGPCGGKTTAADFLKEKLPEYGTEVFIIPEQATALMRDGKTPDVMGAYEFHKLLFSNQLSREEKAIEAARASSAEKAVVICDRGLLDSRAYVAAEDFQAYSSPFHLNEDKIRNRYDAVFHLVSAADGASQSYNLDNSVRSEDLTRARQLDQDILSLWVGTSHLRIIDNRTDFNGKLERLLKEVLAVLGIPEPLEIERKLLIEYPELTLLDNKPLIRRVPITQAYMKTPGEGMFRVRKRGDGDSALYIKTVKYKINDMKRIEIESYISEKEYCDYLKRSDCVQGIISKDRYCIAYNSNYFELDVYPFWQDRATLEIELLSEDETFETPDFIKVIRDVSSEKEYRNKRLAVYFSSRSRTAAGKRVLNG